MPQPLHQLLQSVHHNAPAVPPPSPHLHPWALLYPTTAPHAPHLHQPLHSMLHHPPGVPPPSPPPPASAAHPLPHGWPPPLLTAAACSPLPQPGPPPGQPAAAACPAPPPPCCCPTLQPADARWPQLRPCRPGARPAAAVPEHLLLPGRS
eukprot:scaffold14444_cov18-Tisochrysis_lutea.AAC.2